MNACVTPLIINTVRVSSDSDPDSHSCCTVSGKETNMRRLKAKRFQIKFSMGNPV